MRHSPPLQGSPPAADDLGVEDLLDRTRCPHCRAAVRPDAPWCGLCHADLRPAPAPEPVAAPVPVVPTPAPAASPAAAPTGEPTWPCATCGAANALAAPVCAACGAGFLAGLRESEPPLLELPGVGDLTKMGRGQRVLLALVVVLAVSALVLVLGLLLS